MPAFSFASRVRTRIKAVRSGLLPFQETRQPYDLAQRMDTRHSAGASVVLQQTENGESVACSRFPPFPRSGRGTLDVILVAPCLVGKHHQQPVIVGAKAGSRRRDVQIHNQLRKLVRRIAAIPPALQDRCELRGSDVMQAAQVRQDDRGSRDGRVTPAVPATPPSTHAPRQRPVDGVHSMIVERRRGRSAAPIAVRRGLNPRERRGECRTRRPRGRRPPRRTARGPAAVAASSQHMNRRWRAEPRKKDTSRLRDTA